MTASNHLLAGAAIAVSVKQPLLVIPMALVSHFVMDAFPHFGVHQGQPFARNRNPLFRVVLTIDILLAITMCVVLPILVSRAIIPTSVLAIGMLLAWLPDSIWVYRFFHEIKSGHRYEHKGLVDRFHAAIQRESVRGIFVELVCLCALILYVLSFR